MKVSVITPAIREHGLDIVRTSLLKQTYKDFTWMVSAPFVYTQADKYIPRRPLSKVDYCDMFKPINDLIRASKDYDLIIICIDLVYLASNTIETLVKRFENDPMSCVSVIGHQYKSLYQNIPIDFYWEDVREKRMKNQFEEVDLINFDMAVSSIPVKGAFLVGGIDEKFDKYGVGDKEMIARMMNKGYKIYLDNTIQFRRLSHDNETLDKEKKKIAFEKGIVYFDQCIEDIKNGKRDRLHYLD
jgi:hypothetical protein